MTTTTTTKPAAKRGKDNGNAQGIKVPPGAGLAELAATMPGLVAGPVTGLDLRPKVVFETEPNSPFADGYSIAKERAALADLLASDAVDETDPRYPRLELLDDRQREFERMAASYKARQGAEPMVTTPEAAGMRQLGALVDEDVDSMTLHTKEGYRLFMGRSRSPDGSYAQIVGGKRVASALRTLWMLTGQDNPYADWALVRHEQNLALMTQRIEEASRSAQAELDAMRRKGLNYAVLVSSEPKSLSLGFKSPYGYAIAELVVAYDYFIRISKTLGRKNLRSDDQVRQTIRELTRFIRRCFNELARFERWLIREELRSLARADFLPSGDADAAKRVQAATAIFGPVPAEVFSGRLSPRHSRRRQSLSQAEQKLLDDVSVDLAKAEAVSSAVADDDGAGLV